MTEQASQQAQPTQLLKFSAHHFRAEGVDEQAFAKWYQEEQIPRMIKIIQKHGITRYNLFVTPASLRSFSQADLDSLKGSLPDWEMTQYDVTSSYWATPDQLWAMLTDSDWQGKVIKFEEGWIDTFRAECQIGWETTFLQDGKTVNVDEMKEYPN